MTATKEAKEGLPRLVRLDAGGRTLEGELVVPAGAAGLVIFAHGSGSGRHSPRNQFVAAKMHDKGLATLLLDLLTREEEAVDLYTRHLRFDIPMLATRLHAAAAWASSAPETRSLNIGIFGASTGAAAALIAAAQDNAKIKAVVSRGGRPDLAGSALSWVTAPVLLIVGGLDDAVIELNRQAYSHLNCERELVIVPGATHLFEEPGTLEKVAELAANWFGHHL